MQAIPDSHNITVVGAWNRSIFHPTWVAENLVEGEGGEVGLEVAVESPTLPLRLLFDGVRLRLGADRIVVSSDEVSDAGAAAIERVARAILELLPHTPIQAIGINFGWREAEPPENVRDVFSVSDNGSLADAGAQIATTEVKRSTTYEDQNLNLVMKLDANAVVTFEMNFHWQVPDAAAALEHLHQGIGQFRQRATNLLTETYHLDLDG